MSEQNKGKRTSSTSTIVATAIVALAAIAAIVVLIVMSKKADEGQTDLQNSLMVESAGGQAFIDECGEHAQALVAGNYRIVRLYISEGMSYRAEPYGNRPEGGYYAAVSDEFKTYEDIDNYVRSIFVQEEAERILFEMPYDPKDEYGSEDGPSNTTLRRFVPIYSPRVDYVDAEEASEVTSEDTVSRVPDVVVPSESGDSDASSSPSAPAYVKKYVLGIHEDFKPYTDYKKPWGSISIKILPVSEEECDITIYLGADKDVDLSSVEESDILKTKMVKENGEWRLTKLVF